MLAAHLGEPGTSQLYRSKMTIDNTQRAVLTIGALTQLALLRRNTSPDDTSGMVSVELLERLVINGSVSERDEILQVFMKTESLDSILASRQTLEVA